MTKVLLKKFKFIKVGKSLVKARQGREGMEMEAKLFFFSSFFQVSSDIAISDTKSSQRPKTFTAFFYHTYHTLLKYLKLVSGNFPKKKEKDSPMLDHIQDSRPYPRFVLL
jgi:hypothetical protein